MNIQKYLATSVLEMRQSKESINLKKSLIKERKQSTLPREIANNQ